MVVKEKNYHYSTCVDTRIGTILKSIDYSFSGSVPEKRKEYESHLNYCQYCQKERKKVMARKRFIGFGITISGIILTAIFFAIMTGPNSGDDVRPRAFVALVISLGLVLHGILQLLKAKSYWQK